jgi:hypothetical protein
MPVAWDLHYDRRVSGEFLAHFMVGYVDYRDRPLVTLPGYAPGGGGGVERSQRHGQTCPDCFTLRSLTGVCACDAG